MMGLVRTSVALIVALCVAAMPLAGAAARGLKPAAAEPAAMTLAHGTHAAMHADPSAVADSDASDATASSHMDDPAAAHGHECCPDHPNPGQADPHCQSMMPCAQCFGMSSVALPDLAYPPLRKEALAIVVEQAAPLFNGSPPDRPPRS